MGETVHEAVPNIPGIRAEGDLLRTLQRDVARLLGRDITKFPGAQPVSFARQHLFELQKQDYYVCEKSDGIRCLMYLTHERTPEGDSEVTYLIDRKNDYYWVQALHFPLPDEERLFHIDTLVDGELVNDVISPGQPPTLKYLVFDCMVLDGSTLMHRTLDKRLAYFRDKIFNPYKSLYEKYPEEIQFLPFIVEFKSMDFSYGIEHMFKNVLPNLPHGNDGLIFTCRNTPYKFGTDEHILKWKAADQNSIDFMLTLIWPVLDPDSEDERDGQMSPYPDYEAMPTFRLSVLADSREYKPFGTMYLTDQEWEDLKALNQPLDDRIVECAQDDSKRWRFLKFRDDKREGNHISTVDSVMQSIEDRIGKEDLIRNAKRVRDGWKQREAIAKEEAIKASRKKVEANAKVQALPSSTQARTSRQHGSEAGVGSGTGPTSSGANNEPLGVKRKLLDDDEDEVEGDEGAKKRNTPQPPDS